MELDNTAILITGGTKGIGAATALALAEKGANVAVVGRRPGVETEALVGRITQLGRRCVVLTADVSVPAAARQCVRDALAQLGGLDGLVHSAGGPVPGTFMELDAATWHAAFDTHVHPIFHLCQEAIPLLRQRRQGAIILVSSSAGLRGVAGAVAYQTVKGVLPQLTRAMARELAADNIRVNCVAPGVIRTDFHAQMPAEVRKNNLENRIPLRREGTPAQVAHLIRELMTNDYITGETMSIDGGLTMRIC